MFFLCSKNGGRTMSALAFREPHQAAFDFEPDPAAPRHGARAPREQKLRSLAPCHASRFTAWRGRSGRRYVASSFMAADDGALSFPDSVLIAVDAGRRIVGVREAGPWGLEAAVSRWRDEAMGAGAVEIHVHLIAATPEDRRRAVADLTPVH
jgi:hypothetical protein